MAQSRKLKVAIIGMGGNGTGAARAIAAHPEVAELVAVAEPDAGARERARKTFSVPTVADYRELLKRNDIDLIKVSTPNQSHAEIATAFLLAGKHVYCEKPMAMSLADCQAMLDAEKRSGKRLVIGFELPYSTFGRRLEELVRAGAVGNLKSMQFHHSRGGWGQKSWALDRSLSGGGTAPERHHGERKTGKRRNVAQTRRPDIAVYLSVVQGKGHVRSLDARIALHHALNDGFQLCL